MLGQTELISILERCNGDKVAIEECLSAYVVWKYMKGRSSAHILEKLRSLTLYMRITGHGHIIDNARKVFVVIASEVALGGESRIGVLPAITPLGRECANRIRRRASTLNRGLRLVTDGAYGGPMPVQHLMDPEQRRPVVSSRGESGAGPSSPRAENARGADVLLRTTTTARTATAHPEPPSSPTTSGDASLGRAEDRPERSPWAERYFRQRPQFGNEGVPAYVPPGYEDPDEPDATLPLYSMAPSYHSGSVHSTSSQPVAVL